MERIVGSALELTITDLEIYVENSLLPRKTRPFITERLLIVCKESNQTKPILLLIKKTISLIYQFLATVLILVYLWYVLQALRL